MKFDKRELSDLKITIRRFFINPLETPTLLQTKWDTPEEIKQLVHCRSYKNELKSIKVAITRRNVSEPNTSTTLLRSLDDPAQLVVHYRADEGVRPIFDRDDIVVNKENSQEERTILSSLIPEQKTSTSQPATSRSSSRSSRSSLSPNKCERKRSSPQPHSSREEPSRQKDYYLSRHRRSSSNSRKAVYKTRQPPSPSGYRPHRYSRSPPRYSRRTPSPPSKDKARPRERSPGYRSSEKEKSPQRHRAKPKSKSPYRGPPDRRRSSRSPPPSHRSGDRGRYSRSPHKYRGPPERKRSRSPPPSTRGRSRSHSPYHRSRRSRSRYSRSPHRHEEYRRYERSKRSRSPRRHSSRYSPERHSRRSPHDEREYQGPKFPPNPYFEGAEFWIPDPTMQPRFIPRHMIPPAAFPYGPPLRPGMPMMMPPRIPFRPRIVYNRPPRPRAPVATVQAIESATNTVTTAATTSTVTSSDETQRGADAVQTVKEPEHSSPKKSDNDKES